jgi:hypothetical protein
VLCHSETDVKLVWSSIDYLYRVKYPPSIFLWSKEIMNPMHTTSMLIHSIIRSKEFARKCAGMSQNIPDRVDQMCAGQGECWSTDGSVSFQWRYVYCKETLIPGLSSQLLSIEIYRSACHCQARWYDLVIFGFEGLKLYFNQFVKHSGKIFGLYW